MRVFLSHFKRGQAGQTLVDLVVSLALLSSSVASAGVISTLSSHVGDESGRRSQATSLATRELEGLRQYRTDTVLNPGSTWADVFKLACPTFVMQRHGADWSQNCVSAPVQFGPADDPAFTGTSPYAGFSRLITAKANSGDPNFEMVEVKVSWDEGDRVVRNVTLHTVLANWKQ